MLALLFLETRRWQTYIFGFAGSRFGLSNQTLAWSSSLGMLFLSNGMRLFGSRWSCILFPISHQSRNVFLARDGSPTFGPMLCSRAKRRLVAVGSAWFPARITGRIASSMVIHFIKFWLNDGTVMLCDKKSLLTFESLDSFFIVRRS